MDIPSLTPSKNHYQVELTGIAEQVNLNMFETRAAKLNSSNLKLKMTLSPTDYDIPRVEDLKKISQREIVYAIQQRINH